VDAPIRGVALLRAGVGAALTVFPDRVASAAEGRPAASLARRATRVLGVRQLVQATLTLTAPQLLPPLRGAVIDALHLVSTMLLAAVSPRHRRAALMNAALAATFCGLGIVRAQGLYAQDHRADSRRDVTPAERQEAPSPSRRADRRLRTDP
jgi:hypothetical protein